MKNLKQLEKHIKECVDLKVMIMSTTEAYKDCIEAVAEKYEEYDNATIRAMAEKAYKSMYDSEKYEKEKKRTEEVYDVVESLK